LKTKQWFVLNLAKLELRLRAPHWWVLGLFYSTSKEEIILQSSFTAASDGAVHHSQFAQSAEPHWLTADQVAAYLQVERRTVLKWANSGKLKAYSLSGTRRRTWRFLKLDVDAIFGLSSESLSFSGRVN
jgi:excisionase family DNA binding protein